MAGGFTKEKRYQSKRNIGIVKNLPCLICLKRPSDADHIRTRGAGGGDNLGNLQPLCREHHTFKHSVGIKTFLNMYFSVIVERRRDFNLPPMQIKHIEEIST